VLTVSNVVDETVPQEFVTLTEYVPLSLIVRRFIENEELVP